MFESFKNFIAEFVDGEKHPDQFAEDDYRLAAAAMLVHAAAIDGEMSQSERDKLHAVIGGFHLTGPLFEPIIGDTVGALEQLAPDVIIPAHCTGWKATHAIARHLPGAFIQNSVGTTFHFSAVSIT